MHGAIASGGITSSAAVSGGVVSGAAGGAGSSVMTAPSRCSRSAACAWTTG